MIANCLRAWVRQRYVNSRKWKSEFFCSLSDDILLQRYLKVYDNGDLRKSQDLLKFNLDIRKTGPQIFKNRDILSDKTQVAAKTM